MSSSAKRPQENMKQLAERHVAMVRASASRDEWTVEMWNLLKSLMEDEKHNRGVFNEPVDDKQVLGYYTVIRNPMDFGTIKGRLEDGVYPSVDAFAKDVQLVFANAVVYNLPDHFVHRAAKGLKVVFEEKFAIANKKIAAEAEKRANHHCDVCAGRKCEVCLKGCLEYAPPDIRCSPPCKARIPRNATYYRLGGDRGQHWCQRCYSSLKEEFIGLLGQVVKKSELEQCCNNQVYREAWLRCARCDRWSHMICSLFIDAFNRSSDPAHSVPSNADPAPERDFTCVLCWAESTPSPKPMRPIQLSVVDCLPVSPMSDFLEKRLRESVVIELTTKPISPGHALLHPRLSRAEAERIAATLKVRTVANMRSEGGLEARIRKWVETQCFLVNRLPGEALVRFPHRAKTICIFQETSKLETMLCFALYVQEYGQECPVQSANRGAVYVSYLDSVPYIRPRRLRTVCYQEMMLSYFLWVRHRGFDRCYIWACPPQKGDAYVMHCHPPWQRNPSAERLRKWYHTIFKQAHKENMVKTETTMYDRHLATFKPIVHTRRSVQFITSPSMDHDHRDGNGEDKNVMMNGEEEIIPFTAPAPHGHTGPFHLEQLPYFTGDFIYSELETILAHLEQLDSDLTEVKMRQWWLKVWGPNAAVEVVKEEGARDDALLFDETGLPYPGTLIYVKPSVPTPTREVLMRLERECCTVGERDEWIMRKVAGAVRPQKDNFFVLVFTPRDTSPVVVPPVKPPSPPAAVNPVPASKKTKMMPMPEEEEVVERTVPPATLTEDLADPDPLLPRTCFDSRICFLDLCIVNHIQFSSYRHAKFSSAVVLSYLERALRPPPMSTF